MRARTARAAALAIVFTVSFGLAACAPPPRETVDPDPPMDSGGITIDQPTAQESCPDEVIADFGYNGANAEADISVIEPEFDVDLPDGVGVRGPDPG